MSATSVAGFKPIPQELLDQPKPCLMSPDELQRTLAWLISHGLIEAVLCSDDTVGYRPTARGLRLMGKPQ